MAGGRMVQRHVLYLGEINDSQKAAWCKTIEVFDEGGQQARQLALFPEDRRRRRWPAMSCMSGSAVCVCAVRGNGVPAGWAASCGISCSWTSSGGRLPASRQGTRWLNVLETLVVYRLIDPGSEWRLHRQWFEQSAMADLLGEDFGLAQKDKLYRCLDKLLAHKTDLFSFAAALGDAVRCQVRRAALRFDQHVFRVRSARIRQAALWLQPGQAVRTACRWSSPWSSRRRAFRWPTK